MENYIEGTSASIRVRNLNGEISYLRTRTTESIIILQQSSDNISWHDWGLVYPGKSPFNST